MDYHARYYQVHGLISFKIFFKEILSKVEHRTRNIIMIQTTEQVPE